MGNKKLFKRYRRTYKYKNTGNFKAKSIIDFQAYKYYREKSPKMCTRKNISSYVEYGKIMSLFYKKIGEYISETSEGVFIEGLGYFGVAVYRNQIGYCFYHDEHGNYVTDMNAHTDGKIYSILFVPQQYQANLRTFTMDYTFAPRVNRRLAKKLRAGKKYRLNATLFQK